MKEPLKTIVIGLAVLFGAYVVLAIVEALPALPAYHALFGGH